MKKRVILLVLDSLGVGYMDDVLVDRKQDEGADTFYHILEKAKHISLPTLKKLGINKVVQHPRLNGEARTPAAYGRIKLEHAGADSYAGHQEIMGTKPRKPGIVPFQDVIGKVGNALASEGYQVRIPDPQNPYLIVNDLVVVADNIETDYGQIYNVTAPLDRIPFAEVLKVGKIVRNKVKVNRVIALGGEEVEPEQILESIEVRSDGLVGANSPKSGVYRKGYQCRHLGYGVNPQEQISGILISAGKEVTLIGKMQDVIECSGARKIPAVDTGVVMKEIIDNLGVMEEGLIAATVQETDLAGHAQDVQRYAEVIMAVDGYLERILELMTAEDLLLITADHGNDPTIGHSRHTREKTFLLAYGRKMRSVDLGTRNTLSDIGATISEYFSARTPENGVGFFQEIKGG